MRQASQYDDWSGYKGKAERLLNRDLENLDETGFYFGWGQFGPLPRDGEWLRLGHLYNVGAKFLRWMVDNGMLERRGRGLSVEALKNDWYRPRGRYNDIAPLPDDFGDLWVA